MTRLLWDQVSERLYEAGLDHGVLYLEDGTGIPWNGLTGIEEDMEGDVSNPSYFDGIKYLDVPSIGDFSATLTAFTYPDEFLDFEGIASLGGGIFVDGQNSKLFGLSYRTRVGNDYEGTDHGYKIHILYNLTAVPSPVDNSTLSNEVSPLEFSWTITGVPVEASGYRPTAHVIFDSRYLNPAMLADLEAVLYGDADQDAHIPTVNELIDFVSLWGPKLIVPEIVTGLAQLLNGGGDLTPVMVDGLYSALPTTRLVETEIPGLYELVP